MTAIEPTSGADELTKALDHVLEARRHLRAAWRIAKSCFPDLAVAIEPAGAVLSGILDAVQAAVSQARERRREAALRTVERDA